MSKEHRDQGPMGSVPSTSTRPKSAGKAPLTKRLAPAKAPVKRAAPPSSAAALQLKSMAEWTHSVLMKAAHGFPGQRQPSADLRLEGSGQSLPAPVQTKMEQSFGADFSAVRVHEGEQARSIGARAFTRGTQLCFAPGEYQPNTPAGQELIGHELAHVVQQSQGRVSAPTQSKGGVAVNADSGLEREADEQGARAAAGLPAAGGAGQQGGAPGQPSQADLEAAYPAEHVRPISIAELQSAVIQPAWVGKRPLEGTNFIAGAFHHKHIFFEDGLTPPNIGFMGPQGLGQDTSGMTFTPLHTGLDDAVMRQAVADVGDPGDYHLIINDCQRYVSRVLDRYFALQNQENAAGSCQLDNPPPEQAPPAAPGAPPPAAVAGAQVTAVVDTFVDALDTADRQGFRHVDLTLERTRSGLVPGWRNSQQERPSRPAGEQARGALRPLVETVARQAPSRNTIAAQKQGGLWQISFRRSA